MKTLVITALLLMSLVVDVSAKPATEENGQKIAAALQTWPQLLRSADNMVKRKFTNCETAGFWVVKEAGMIRSVSKNNGKIFENHFTIGVTWDGKVFKSTGRNRNPFHDKSEFIGDLLTP